MFQAELNPVQQIAEKLAEKLRGLDCPSTQPSDGKSRYQILAAALDDCLAALSALNIWGPENRLPSSEVWNIAGDWLARGWLQTQARTKPRGYAGDYEMLSRIYASACCNDPLGQLFDRYFQAQAAPQAVRHRMRMMSEWISSLITINSSAKIAIVGSAFGLEVRDALLATPVEARQSLQVVLLDLDPAALDFARAQLDSLLGSQQLVLQSVNLFRLADRPGFAANLTGANLILCPGLFDYLDDAAAVAMIRCLFDQLSSGGELVIFQFAPHNPTRAYMEWFANWYLTYREEDAFRRLLGVAKLPGAAIEFAAEPLGIDLYAKITRNDSTASRAV